MDANLRREDFLGLESCLREVVTAIAFCSVYLLVIFSSGDSVSKFGIWPIKLKWLDLVWVGLTIGSGGLYLYLIQHYGDRHHFSLKEPYWSYGMWFGEQVRVQLDAPLALIVLGQLCAALASRLFFQAYLITRLSELLRFRWAAVIVSSLIFALAVNTGGVIGSTEHFAEAMLLGTIYVASGSLWPLVIGTSLAWACDVVFIIYPAYQRMLQMGLIQKR